MKFRQPQEPSQEKLFRGRLEIVLNQRSELVRLAEPVAFEPLHRMGVALFAGQGDASALRSASLRGFVRLVGQEP